MHYVLANSSFQLYEQGCGARFCGIKIVTFKPESSTFLSYVSIEEAVILKTTTERRWLGSGGEDQHRLQIVVLKRRDFVLQRILTAEYVDACRVDDVEDLKRRGLNVADVSNFVFLRCHLRTNNVGKEEMVVVLEKVQNVGGKWQERSTVVTESPRNPKQFTRGHPPFGCSRKAQLKNRFVMRTCVIYWTA